MNLGPRKTRKPLTSEQQSLAESCVKLAQHLSLPYKLRGATHKWGIPSNYHEFKSCSFYALIEAAGAFRTGFGVKFSTFATHRIRGALVDACRKAERVGREQQASLWDTHRQSGIPRLEEKGFLVGHGSAPPSDREIEGAEETERLLACLRPQHAKVFRMLAIDGLSQAEIGEKLGLSAPRISEIVSKSRRHLARIILAERAREAASAA